MPKDEIELDGVRIVRADLVEDAPVDAIDATRSGGRGKPGFLATISCGLAAVAPAAAVADDLETGAADDAPIPARCGRTRPTGGRSVPADGNASAPGWAARGRAATG